MLGSAYSRPSAEFINVSASGGCLNDVYQLGSSVIAINVVAIHVQYRPAAT